MHSQPPTNRLTQTVWAAMHVPQASQSQPVRQRQRSFCPARVRQTSHVQPIPSPAGRSSCSCAGWAPFAKTRSAGIPGPMRYPLDWPVGQRTLHHPSEPAGADRRPTPPGPPSWSPQLHPGPRATGRLAAAVLGLTMGVTQPPNRASPTAPLDALAVPCSSGRE